MNIKPLVDLAAQFRPGDRLDWIRHLSKYPNHVVAVVAIRSVAGAVVAIAVAWLCVAFFRW